MAKKPTIGDILKRGKLEAEKIRKKSIPKIPVPIKALPRPLQAPLAPVLGGIELADAISKVSLAIVNEAVDIAFEDLQNIPLAKNKRPRTILPMTDQIAETVPKVKRPRTDKQLINDQIMRTAMKNANAKARKKNGQLKKGMTQKKIARFAQLECTKERKRLGLCDDDMKKKSTRKGQVRKTARRAYER